MRLFVFVFVFFSIIVLSNCEKYIYSDRNSNLNNYNDTILIKTNKENYIPGEFVIVELTNYFDSVAYYFHCSSYDGIPPIIYKSENSIWTGYWTPICDGFLSYCCMSLNPGDNYIDTIDIEFTNGTYRIEYLFSIGQGDQDKVFCSNAFSYN